MAEPGSASERLAPSPEPLRETARTPPERGRLGQKLLVAFIALCSLGVLGQAVHDLHPGDASVDLGAGILVLKGNSASNWLEEVNHSRRERAGSRRGEGLDCVGEFCTLP